MATQLRGKSYRILFRYHGKQYAFPLGTVTEAEAEAKSAQVDYLLMRLKQGLIEVPQGTGIVDFVRFDGRPPTRGGDTKSVTKALTLGGLRDRFLEAREGSREENTQATSLMHFKHL